MPHQASLESFSSLSVILSLYLGSEGIVCNYSILKKFTSEKPVKLKPLNANHQKSDVQQDTGGTNMNSSHLPISCIHLFWYIFLSTTARRQEERTCQKSTYAPPVFQSVNVLTVAGIIIADSRESYYTDKSRDLHFRIKTLHLFIHTGIVN